MAIGATVQSSVTRFHPGSRGRRAIQTDGAGSADRKKRTVQSTLGDISIRGYGKHTSQLRVVNIFVQQLLQQHNNDEAFGRRSASVPTGMGGFRKCRYLYFRIEGQAVYRAGAIGHCRALRFK